MQDNLQSFKVSSTNYTSKVTQVGNDFYLMKRVHNWSQETNLQEVFSVGWKLFVVDRADAPIRVRVSNNKVETLAANEMALFLPPFAVMDWLMPAGDLRWSAYLSSQPLKFTPTEAVLIPWQTGTEIKNVNDLDQVFEDSETNKIVSRQAQNCKVSAATQAYLNRHFQIDESTRSIADKLGFSYSTMTHYFRRSFAMSPNEYRRSLRITSAGCDLVSGSKSATESCYDSGFGDYSNFKQGFKKVFGLTPSHFSRHQLLKNKDEEPASPIFEGDL